MGDRVAVVGFSTGTVTPYPLAEVSADPGQPELNAAKAAIDSFTPFDLTAIGQGLLAGQTEVTKAPADFSVADVIILLSDGMENVDPRYDTPAVKGVIEPTDTIVHTVAVGPSNAGMHALLADIADDNGGESYVVNQTGGAAAADAAAVKRRSPAWMPGRRRCPTVWATPTRPSPRICWAKAGSSRRAAKWASRAPNAGRSTCLKD
ncbi:MAG: vWA domain-containing protein [Caldilineaceae bacterium]